jgi:hypothetical protein
MFLAKTNLNRSRAWSDKSSWETLQPAIRPNLLRYLLKCYHSFVLEHTEPSYTCTVVLRTKSIDVSFLWQPYSATYICISHCNSICIMWLLHYYDAAGYVSCGRLWKKIEPEARVDCYSVPAIDIVFRFVTSVSIVRRTMFETLQ